MRKLLTLPTVYTVVAAAIAALTFWKPVLGLISGVLGALGLLTVPIKLFNNQIDFLFYSTLEDFRERPSGELPSNWTVEYPDVVLDKDKDAIKSEVKVVDDKLSFKTWKRSVGIKDEHAWEGTEIISDEYGFNGVIAKLTLDLDESKSKNANIYIKGTGRTGKYEYYLGIATVEREVEKKEEKEPDREIFFHIVDLESDEKVYEDRGRIHLKDYWTEGLDWIYLGMEWGITGPKVFAFIEGEKDFNKITINPPSEVRKDILDDSKKIDFYGLKKFAIRTDLKVGEEESVEKVTGGVQTVHVKFGYLSFFS